MRPKDSLEADYHDDLQQRLDASDDEQAFWYELHDEPVTADGCHVEADGICPHGYQSPLLLLGMI